MPEPSVELCGVFTGMPMICFDEKNLATVHAISAWPVGCAIPGVNVGVWSQITSRSIHKLFFEVERYKQARKDFYENIQLKSTGEVDIENIKFEWDPYGDLEVTSTATETSIPFKERFPFSSDFFAESQGQPISTTSSS